MSMRSCRYAGPDQPRMLRTHTRDCIASGCPGCEPCPERHCALCGIEHVTVEGRGTDEVCAACIGAIREDLRLIVGLSERLLDEALHRGVTSEAASLAGPSIDTPAGIEAWGNRRMSMILGRIPHIEQDERHPLWVTGSWETIAREHLEQPVPDEQRITIAAAAGYLGRQLHVLAHDPGYPTDEMARELRICRGHLEDVLRDGEQVETGVKCPPCGRARLVKSYGASVEEDRWSCPRCGQWWTDAEYREKVTGVYVGVAPALTDRDMETRTRVPAATVRQWATRGKVRRRGRSDDGRVLYDVGDVLACRDADASASA